MKKGFKTFGLVIGTLFLLFVIYKTQPQIYFPHQKISIAVPWDLHTPPVALIPMGETIEHPKPRVPHGHPGIDFQFSKDTPVISAMDGRVSSIVTDLNDGTNEWNIEISDGIYATAYWELAEYNQSLKVGSVVKKGDVIGKLDRRLQYHWEFKHVGSAGPFERLCPVGYFDEESKKQIEHIWETQTQFNDFRAEFPDICSGDFKDYYEKHSIFGLIYP